MPSILSCLGWLLSPTRKIVDLRNRGGAAQRGAFLRSWNLNHFRSEVIASVLFVLASRYFSFGLPIYVRILIAFYALSRCNEIAYAFYRDALSRLGAEQAGSDLSAVDRIRMAMRSYVGLGLNFAAIYYFMPVGGLFNKPPASFFDAIYFSGVTLSTLGYGDVVPMRALSKALAMYEVFAGILLVGVAIATYLGSASGSKGSSSSIS